MSLFGGLCKKPQSAPEIVTLYEVKGVWQAQATEVVAESTKLVQNESSSATGMLQPTAERYHRLLRKISWIPCEFSLLRDALTKLDAYFPDGFTKSEELEYFIELFGDRHTRSELRAVVCILFKAGFVSYRPYQSENEKAILIAQPPASQQAMAERVDMEMLLRLVNACNVNGIPLVPTAVTPLLLGAYSKVKLHSLIEKAQAEQRSPSELD